jgi:hypothetical protein
MATVATDLEWGYQPPDFFEAESTFALDCGMLSVHNGKASLRLRSPEDPLKPETRGAAAAQVEAVLNSRRLLVHRTYTIGGPHVIQHGEDGKRHVAVTLEAGQITTAGGSVDFVVINARGAVVTDSGAERLTAHRQFVLQLATKAARSQLLASLLRSYGAAVSDPNDELVHLYEIRDALASHFLNEEAARNALRVTKQEWQQLGILANVEPLRQGRHRGRHAQANRPANDAELDAARNAAKLLILRFADLVQ